MEGGGARGQKSSLSCIPKKQNSAQGGTLSKLGKWDREIKQDFKFALSIDCDKVPTTGGIYQPDNAVTLGTSPALDASAAQAPLSGPTPPSKYFLLYVIMRYFDNVGADKSNVARTLLSSVERTNSVRKGSVSVTVSCATY